jgi:hypothetical protein
MTKKFPGHGTVYAYNDFSCRCDLCKAAKAEYRKNRMPKYERLTIEQVRELGLPEPKHGTVSSYSNYRCHCPLCTAALTEYMKSIKEEASEKLKQGLANPTHGTWGTYCFYSCRCNECKAAAKEYQHQRYLSKKKEINNE